MRGIDTQISTILAYLKSLIHECVSGQRRISPADLQRATRAVPTESASR